MTSIDQSGAERLTTTSRKGFCADTETLLVRYRRRRSVKLRNELIERHRSQIAGIAGSLSRRLPRSVDVQDLVHAGIWGLMQSIENYEPRRGIPFDQFMRRRARGAMLDELRNLDYLPRLYRQLHRERDQSVVALRGELMRDPSDAEIAARMGISEVRMRRISSSIPANGTDADSAGGLAGVDSLPDLGIESPIEALHRQDLLAVIQDSLEPIEWRVLDMHYLQGLSGKEIARKLRLSASRICQIHGRVLSRLKAKLGARESA